ncbi:MAG: hypothetical protein KDD89_14575 [Anaerolineales bacterium]|nr:hypothetical protein [Anaerolineales bacterium]
MNEPQIQPDDRILVAYVPRPQDFELIRAQGWYRIPEKNAPKGIHAEFIAFYFGRTFGERKWAIHFYAENRGHELVRRVDLLPDEPAHPRAQEAYIKLQLGALQRLAEPIVSLRWRRLLFLHTTGDRFLTAREVRDLVIRGDGYSDRAFVALRDGAGVVQGDLEPDVVELDDTAVVETW